MIQLVVSLDRDVPYRLLQFCRSCTEQLQHSPLQLVQNSAAIGLFSALVGHTTSPLATGQVPNHVQNYYDYATFFAIP